MPDRPPEPNDHEATPEDLVSAYIDDEATPDEVARVEGSAELSDRARALRTQRRAVAEAVPSPPEADLVDRHIGAALEASPTAPNVTAMAGRRRRWRAPVAAAAGVAAALVLAIPIIASLSSDEDDSDVAAVADEFATAEAAEEATADRTEAAVPELGDDQTRAGAVPAFGVVIVGHLGSFETAAAALARAEAFEADLLFAPAAGVDGATDPAVTTAPTEADGAEADAGPCLLDDNSRTGATATVADRAVVITTDRNGTVVVVDVESCAVIES